MGWGWGWGWVKPSGCLPIELGRQSIRIAYALASGGGVGYIYMVCLIQLFMNYFL